MAVPVFQSGLEPKELSMIRIKPSPYKLFWAHIPSFNDYIFNEQAAITALWLGLEQQLIVNAGAFVNARIIGRNDRFQRQSGVRPRFYTWQSKRMLANRMQKTWRHTTGFDIFVAAT